MPVTKQYLRYEAASSFGVICSRKAGAILLEKRGREDDQRRKGTQLVLAPALEHVIMWDMKTSQKVAVLKGESEEVTALSLFSSLLAVGYEDGNIRLFNLESRDSHVTFSGHKSSVISMSFDSSGTRLVSGGKDTDVIVWDIVNECGLYRLKGHKGPVTWCQFMKDSNVLISSSKDMMVKFWDLDTQHCFESLTDHHSEVWGCELLLSDTRLITMSSDSELRVYDISPNATSSSLSPLSVSLLGSLKRQMSGRPHAIKVDGRGTLLVVMSGDHLIEVFAIRSQEEIEKRKKKRIRKAKKKAMEAGEEWVEQATPTYLIDDEFQLIHNFTSSYRMKSCDLINIADKTYQILLSLHENMLELHTLTLSSPSPSSSLTHSLSLPGHRSDIRSVCLSGEGSLLATGSNDIIKIWRLNGECIHTLTSCGYIVSLCFVPGDRHLLAGIKSGDVHLYEISSGVLLETFQAHSRPVWAVGVSPGRRGFATGSADHDVKFWEFELISDEDRPGRKRLTACHVKTLKMSEDVLCLKYSPNDKLLAVSLLDSTVKLFFSDTLKFYLSLYGHKLPVLGMDISSDNTLIVTGSADKNIRIWGLDFGDCHRSIFAHSDSIMDVKFVPGTHLCFSVSKDRTVKQWDSDNFELIQTLKGHHSEIWSLGVSSDGNTVVTGSHDLSIRTWECTQEPLILSEEKENEREMEFEKTVAEGEEPVIPGETRKGEVEMASRKTVGTMESAERIMEAMDIWREEKTKMDEYHEECKIAGQKLAPPPPHPILKVLGNQTPERHVLNVLKRIRSSDLEEALLVIPFGQVIDFLKLCDYCLRQEWEVELLSRCTFFLLKVHHNQITTSKLLLPIIDSLRQHVSSSIESLRDVYGFNLYAMRQLQRDIIVTDNDSNVFTDVSKDSQTKRKKRTRQQQSQST